MIAKHSVPALLLLSVFALPAQAANGLAGNWVTAPSGDGNSMTMCSFTQKGNALSGTCSISGTSGQGPFGPVTGSVNGKNVTWTWPEQIGGATSITSVYAGQWDLKDTVIVQRTFKDLPPGAIVNGSGRAFTFTRSPAK